MLIDYDDLPSAGLLTLGSRARRVLLVRAPDDRIEPLVAALRADFKQEFVNARSYRSSDDEVGRDFDRAENYLSLVGLIVVILGGIAVSSVTRVFIHQKIRSIAVLKCLGASSGQIIAVYLLQVLALGFAGSLLGVAMASGVMAAIPIAMRGSTSLLAGVDYGVTWSAAAQGLGVGLLVSLLFSVVPLLQVRHVKPSLLLREEGASRIQRLGPDRRDHLGLSGACGPDGLAGGIPSCRSDCLRRIRRARVRPAAGGSPAGALAQRRSPTRGRFRCAMPCFICPAPATRRA